MNDNEEIIPCDKCGCPADFGVENESLGMPFTNYCHKCFAEDHPEAVKLKDEAFEEADRLVDRLTGKPKPETFH